MLSAFFSGVNLDKLVVVCVIYIINCGELLLQFFSVNGQTAAQFVQTGICIAQPRVDNTEQHGGIFWQAHRAASPFLMKPSIACLWEGSKWPADIRFPCKKDENVI